ncbi:MAG TPA: hypothetical protein VE623_11595 [Acidimicrobiales bacterium]|nr:hypothetical protein [Acidimicrobiales bacterium]
MLELIAGVDAVTALRAEVADLRACLEPGAGPPKVGPGQRGWVTVSRPVSRNV